MNLGRFHAAIHSLRQELDDDAIIQQLTALQSALQQSISSPTEQTAIAFKEQYSTLTKRLEDAEINRTYPTRKKIYEELGTLNHVGIGLLKRIRDAISENQVTPANALAQIEKITNGVNAHYKKLATIDNAFEDLVHDYDELDYGEFEIGFSLPREVIGATVETLEKEFKEIDYCVRTLQEITNGDGGSPSVRAISASEWQIFLNSLPETAACVSIAIERVVALYKNNLEIKLIKKQLDEKNLPEAVTKPLQEHIENTVKSEIKKISEDIVDQFYSGDEGRKNELKNKVPRALRYIADRIDRGATIEVHAELPKAPTAPVSEDGDEEPKVIPKQELEDYEKLKKQVEAVNDRMASISDVSRENGQTLFLNYEENTDGKPDSD